MLHVTLYKYANKPIIVDKTNYLGTGLAMEGNALSGNQNMENPVILLHFSAEPDYNYAYIQEYHRWYYVGYKTWVGGDVWSLDFRVDELYTYRALVRSLDGLVAYSNSGLQYKFDPRLNYNVPPIRTKLSPAAGVDTSGGVPWVLLRYYNMDMRSSLLDMGNAPTLMNCVYMNTYAYNGFLENYIKVLRDSEALGIAIGNCIVDVSYVHYIGTFPGTSDLNIVFNSFSVTKLNNNAEKTIEAKPVGVSANLCEAYQVDPYKANVPSGLIYQFTDSWLYYWNRTAKRSLNLPWIGNIGIDINQMGWGRALQGTFSVRVSHEPLENAYVITMGYGSPVQWYFETRVSSPNTTNLAFPIDKSFDNLRETQMARIGSLIAQGTIATGMAAGGIGSPAMLGNLMGNILDTTLELENLAVKDALSFTYKGISGGYMDLAQPLTNYVYLEILTTPPADDYLDFWANHGYPDGAHRNLADLTGYVQMQEFEMKYDSNATIGEMSRLEAQLYKGVIL